MCPAVKLLAVLGAVAATVGAEHCTEPKITVPGGIRDKLNNYFYNILRQPVEVFCSSDNNEIIIDVNNAKTINTEIINATTIKAVVETNATEFHVKCERTNDIRCRADLWINVNQYPTIKQFDCFSNNFQFLHCSWISDFHNGNYYFSFTELNGDFISRVCDGRITSKTHYSCLWDLNNIQGNEFKFYKSHNGSVILAVPLHLQVCNAFECVNQTSEINLIAVTKLNAPVIIKIRAHGTGGAILEWRLPDDALLMLGFQDINYLVEYWFSDIEHSVKISETTTARGYESKSTQLRFSCPGKLYRVRISCRPLTAPPKYMSDYSYTSFETAADPGAPADPACDSNPIEVNPPVMVYKVQLLRREIKEELGKFKRFEMRLKEKSALIENLKRSIDGNV